MSSIQKKENKIEFEPNEAIFSEKEGARATQLILSQVLQLALPIELWVESEFLTFQ